MLIKDLLAAFRKQIEDIDRRRHDCDTVKKEVCVPEESQIGFPAEFFDLYLCHSFGLNVLRRCAETAAKWLAAQVGTHECSAQQLPFDLTAAFPQANAAVRARYGVMVQIVRIDDVLIDRVRVVLQDLLRATSYEAPRLLNGDSLSALHEAIERQLNVLQEHFPVHGASWKAWMTLENFWWTSGLYHVGPEHGALQTNLYEPFLSQKRPGDGTTFRDPATLCAYAKRHLVPRLGECVDSIVHMYPRLGWVKSATLVHDDIVKARQLCGSPDTLLHALPTLLERHNLVYLAGRPVSSWALMHGSLAGHSGRLAVFCSGDFACYGASSSIGNHADLTRRQLSQLRRATLHKALTEQDLPAQLVGTWRKLALNVWNMLGHRLKVVPCNLQPMLLDANWESNIARMLEDEHRPGAAFVWKRCRNFAMAVEVLRQLVSLDCKVIVCADFLQCSAWGDVTDEKIVPSSARHDTAASDFMLLDQLMPGPVLTTLGDGTGVLPAHVIRWDMPSPPTDSVQQ